MEILETGACTGYLSRAVTLQVAQELQRQQAWGGSFVFLSADPQILHSCCRRRTGIGTEDWGALILHSDLKDFPDGKGLVEDLSRGWFQGDFAHWQTAAVSADALNKECARIGFIFFSLSSGSIRIITPLNLRNTTSMDLPNLLGSL